MALAVAERAGDDMGGIVAQRCRPRRNDGTPNAAHSSTAGCLSSASSISRGAMFSPPLMISSFSRPVMK